MIRNILSSLLLLLVNVSLASQDKNPPDDPQNIFRELPKVYEITAIEVNVYGLTQRWALLNKLDLYKGQTITGDANWEPFITDKRKKLVSLRIFEESKLTVSITSKKEKNLVTVHITVKDSWNILALPYPKYDSNSGFLLSIKVRDNNFLGTLERLSFDLSYAIKENDKKELGISGGLIFPFLVAETEWDLEFSNTLTLRDNPLPLKYRADLGLTYKVLLFGWRWRAYIKQSAIFNEETDSGDIPELYYNKSVLGLATSMPLGINLGFLGPMEYSASLYGSTTYKWSAPLDDSKQAYSLDLHHNISSGQLFWDSNFRKGFSVRLSNSLGYNLKNNAWRVNVELHLTSAISWNWGGFSHRAAVFYEMIDSRKDTGTWLRGILDKRAQGNVGFILNLDFPFRLLTIQPSYWLNNKCYRLFDFEFHLIPFIDIGWFGTYSQGMDSLPLCGAGFEILVYPYRLKSLFLRISYGIDLIGTWRLGTIYEKSPQDGFSLHEISITIGNLFY